VSKNLFSYFFHRYKEALLGDAAKSGNVIVGMNSTTIKNKILGACAKNVFLNTDPSDPRKVIVKRLALVVAGMPDKELDLTGDLSKLKDQKFKIKEGVQYCIRIDFIVQREIVQGLKYVQKTYRKGIPGKYLLYILM